MPSIEDVTPIHGLNKVGSSPDGSSIFMEFLDDKDNPIKLAIPFEGILELLVRLQGISRVAHSRRSTGETQNPESEKQKLVSALPCVDIDVGRSADNAYVTFIAQHDTELTVRFALDSSKLEALIEKLQRAKSNIDGLQNDQNEGATTKPGGLAPRVLAGEAPAGVVYLQDSKGKLHPSEVIFPIIHRINESEFEVLGTGFYISNHGVFVTAKHVVCDEQEPDTPLAGLAAIHFLSGDNYIERPLQQVCPHGTSDIAIGILAQATNNETGEVLLNRQLAIRESIATVDQDILTLAYPNITIRHVNNQSLVNFYASFFMGTLKSHSDKSRDSFQLPQPHYYADLFLHPGSSGGPVLDSNGAAFAVNTSSFSGMENVAFLTPTYEALNLTLKDIRLSPNEEPKEISVRDMVSRGFVFLKEP